MEETKSLRCTHCGSHHLKHLNNEELICESCNAIVKLNKSIEFEKLYKKLLAENKDVDIKNKRLLVSKSLSPRLDKDSLIKYSQDILEVLPEDVLSTFYINYANRKNNPLGYEAYLNILPNISTKTELDLIIDIIIDNAIYREKDCIENIINSLYKEKQERLDMALQKRSEEAELYSDIKRDIFICHQSNDKKIVDEVLKALEDDGYVCWVSYRNLPWDTDNYWLNIEKAIKSCDIFLCISSKNAMQSIDCRKEIEIASEYNKTKKIEYKIDDSRDITLFKNFFTGQWIEDIDTLLDKVYNLKNKEQSLYKEAKNYLAKYEYLKAKEIFKEILFYSNYKDTDKYITICDKLIACVELINNGFLVDARKKLIELNNIELTKHLLEKCEVNLEENESKDKKEDSIDVNKELSKIKVSIDIRKKYEDAEKEILSLLEIDFDNYNLWYYYLKAITKGFVDTTNENISLCFDNLYRLVEEKNKEELDYLNNKLNPEVIKQRELEEEKRKQEELRKQKEERAAREKQKKLEEERLEKERETKAKKGESAPKTVEDVLNRLDYLVLNDSLEQENLENERKQERLINERLEKEKLERERLEKERLEKERQEQLRLLKERFEKERLEHERLEKIALEQKKQESFDEHLKELTNSKQEIFNTTYIKHNNNVYFGTYPQTIKEKDVSIINKITCNNNEYYIGSDNSLYVKKIAKAHAPSYTFSNGEIVANGKEYYFKVELIKWNILFEENGKALLMTDKILDTHIFDNNSSVYNKSEIKTYLNTDLLNYAFTDKQKAYMYSTSGDKLFLLNNSDLKNPQYGFDKNGNSNEINRMKKVTDYAIANNAYYATDSKYLRNGVYWTKSNCNNVAVYIGNCFGVVDNSVYIKNDWNGVAPATYFKLK